MEAASDDGILVQRCRAGDETALQAFVARFENSVFGLCYRMLRHRQDAEDTVQDVLLRAIRGLGGWDSRRPLHPWIMTIAANRCRTAIHRRANKPEVPLAASESIIDRHHSPDFDLAEEIEWGLGRLREEYRQCFILFHQAELSCAEIGEILDRPVGTVKNWLHRARRELAEHLTRRGIPCEDRHELHRVLT